MMTTTTTPAKRRLTHLQRLEAESIHIMREAAAESEHPVMLYSVGKDSSVMLHLAMKAFYPSLPPFPLLHVDTTWKFQEMYTFRERLRGYSEVMRQAGLQPRVLTACPITGWAATGGCAASAASSLINRSASAAMLSGACSTSRSSAQW